MKPRKRRKRKGMKKTVLYRAKSTRELVAASQRWSPRAAADLQELLAPALAEGETMPDLALVQELCGRTVEMRWQELDEADAKHEQQVVEHQMLLDERAVEVRSLFRELSDLRTVFRGHFGAERANGFLGFSGETSRDPVVLLRQADRAVGRLRDRSKALPPASFPPTAEARASWAKSLARKAKALRKVDRRTSLAAKRLEQAAALRQRALDDFNDVFARLAGFLEAIYRAAGLDRFADAIHPSGRRKGRLLCEVERGPRRKTAVESEPSAAEPSQPSTAEPFTVEPQRRPLRLVEPAAPSTSQPRPRVASAGASARGALAQAVDLTARARPSSFARARCEAPASLSDRGAT